MIDIAYETPNGTAQPVVADPGTATTTRRQELASFLKARREALAPSNPGTRRRVKGLRREEVAEAAGISVAWYTWIEQARELNLSTETLEGLSRALQLQPQERSHLYELAGSTAPLTEDGQVDLALPSIRQMLDSMHPNPSYVLDLNWNVLAWNASADTLFGFSQMPVERRNYIWLCFTSPDFRALFTRWEGVAHCAMAHFRTDSVGSVEDPAWLARIEELCAASPEFREWWPLHNVAWPHSWRKELRHPHNGQTVYNTFDLELYRPARLRIVTYMPESG